MTKDLQDFFNKASFKNKSYQKLWEDIKDKPSFETQKFFYSPKENKNSFLPKANFSGTEGNYLPIEFLKGDQSFYLSQDVLDKPSEVFLSSGTTKSNRSKSYFSKDGLLLYKLQSVKIFFDLLSLYYGKEGALKTKGFSLIPDRSEWKTSSLAQMIEWFSEFWDLRYVKRQEDFLIESSDPVWIFGTALHFMDLVSKKIEISLPKASLIFETGGLKSSKTSFTRADLFTGLSKTFLLEESSIISEYSMCELSTQAYDFVLDSEKPKERFYRFPFWVDLSVSVPHDKMNLSGKGCLTIFDCFRIDYPFPLRTQDIVILDENKKFTYLKRVPDSILKGCSLLAEEVLQEENSNQNKVFDQDLSYFDFQELKLNDDLVLNVFKFLQNFFEKKSVKAALFSEFYSSKLVTDSISDLLSKFPKTFEAWSKILSSLETKKGEKWLLILPNSHLFAVFYPVVLAYFLRLKITVRLSRFYDESSLVGDFLLDFSREFSFPLDLLGSDKRFPQDIKKENYHGVSAFGSNETLGYLKPYLPKKTCFFGSTLSFSLVDSFNELNLEKAIKDAFSLGQKGCFSSRLLFCTEPFHEIVSKKNQIDEFLGKILSRFSFDFPLERSLALDYERLRFFSKKNALFFYFKKSSPLFLFYKYDSAMPFEDYLSSSLFSLPIVFVRGLEEIESFLLEISDQKSFSLSDKFLSKDFFKNIRLSRELPLGSLNETIWNGTHQGKKLFSTSF